MIFKNLEKKRKKLGTLSFALIDPDVKNDSRLTRIINIANKSEFDAILVGGSSIVDNNFLKRVNYIRLNTDLPIILFPGDSNQISPDAHAILFTTLLNSRLSKYLIEEQLKSVDLINDYNLEVIPTSYILFKTDKKSTVENISKSVPIDMNNFNDIKRYILVSIYLGKQAIFLESGSNSNMTINKEIIKSISSISHIPIIVGGGIKTVSSATTIAKSGASYIVIGSKLEEAADYLEILDINQGVHDA